MINYVVKSQWSFAHVHAKVEDNDKVTIHSDGSLLYFQSARGKIRKFKFDKLYGGDCNWIDADINIFDHYCDDDGDSIGDSKRLSGKGNNSDL